jgi:hypothetical protein
MPFFVGLSSVLADKSRTCSKSIHGIVTVGNRFANPANAPKGFRIEARGDFVLFLQAPSASGTLSL